MKRIVDELIKKHDHTHTHKKKRWHTSCTDFPSIYIYRERHHTNFFFAKRSENIFFKNINIKAFVKRINTSKTHYIIAI